jgi:hypothetical protein
MHTHTQAVSTDTAVVGCMHAHAHLCVYVFVWQRWCVGTAAPVFSSATLLSASVVAAGAHDGCVYLLSLQHGHVPPLVTRVRLGSAPVYATVAADGAGGAVVAAIDGQMWSITPDRAQPKRLG